MRQKRVTLFEVDDFENLKNVIDKKYELVKNAIFLLKKRDSEIEEFLKSKNISYFVGDRAYFSEVEAKKEVKVVEKVVEVVKEVVKEVGGGSKVFKRVIRAGEEIDTNENLVFLERINPGAVIKTTGNIEIFAENLGKVECEGEYAILKKGKIIFHKEEIDVDKLSFISREGVKIL